MQGGAMRIGIFTDPHYSSKEVSCGVRYNSLSLKKIGYAGDLSFETFNQVRLGDFAKELVIPWLNLLGTIGKHFRNKILN